MAYKEFFSGKRITLMGLGLLGRGVGDAQFLAPLCKELVVTDQKTEEQLAPSLALIKQYPNIRFVGAHREEYFTGTDMVIKAAGVPLDSPYIAAAHAAQVPVYMSTALFAKFAQEAGARIVGVTGTRGKSTVTHLIYHALAQAGKRALLGGNIRGLSTLAMLPRVRKGDIAVLELDSWQLQGFGDLRISPHIAVFTNIMADHLNYYKGDAEAYFWDKANIFLHQQSGDKLIVGAAVLGKIKSANPPILPVVPPPLPQGWSLQLLGEHNRDNAALAMLALKFLGLAEEDVRAGLESFQPVEGRLQKVAEIKGISVYNDNNATTPEATLAALRAFGDKKITLIAGGADKELPLEELAQEIIKRTSSVVLLPGTGTERLKLLLTDFAEVTSMKEAVEKALQSGNEVILLSPAFASFGLFKNEYDRNDQFIAAVRKLQ